MCPKDGQRGCKVTHLFSFTIIILSIGETSRITNTKNNIVKLSFLSLQIDKEAQCHVYPLSIISAILRFCAFLLFDIVLCYSFHTNDQLFIK